VGRHLRAVRTTSRIDRDLSEAAPPYLVVLKGGSNFTSETVIAYELGLRAQFNSRFTASISSFYNEYNDVRSASVTPNTFFPFYFANNVAGHTDGLELSGNYQVVDGWSLHAGYTLLEEHLHVKPGQYDLNNARNEVADPEHQLSLRSSLNLPGRLELDAGLRWVDTPAPCGRNGARLFRNGYASGMACRRTARTVDRRPESAAQSSSRVWGTGPDASGIERSVYGKVAWRY